MNKNVVLSIKITEEQQAKIKEMRDSHCLNICALIRNFIDEQYQKVTSTTKTGG
jgi:hypothetical protein